MAKRTPRPSAARTALRPCVLCSSGKEVPVAHVYGEKCPWIKKLEKKAEALGEIPEGKQVRVEFNYAKDGKTVVDADYVLEDKPAQEIQQPPVKDLLEKSSEILHQPEQPDAIKDPPARHITEKKGRKK